jgi:hypothetical protein
MKLKAWLGSNLQDETFEPNCQIKQKYYNTY